MPKCVSSLCKDELKIPLTSRILDLGCGSGLVGVELRNLGYTGTITGVDMSTTSLDVSAKRNVYTSLEIANLSENISFLSAKSGTYDLVTCVGTTTYLSPDVLTGWKQLVRPGGLIVLTHRLDIGLKWLPAQDKLCENGVLEHVMTSKELLYLPGFNPEKKEYVQKSAQIYVFRRPMDDGARDTTTK